jgi:hypothetical protein
MDNLEDVITDSVNDAVNESELETSDSGSEAAEDATPAETPSASDSTPEDAAADTSADSSAVASPAAAAADVPADEPQDEFSKLVGVPQLGFGGRENRIPYSRVKKITEKAADKAASDLAEVALGRKLNPGEKALDVVKAHVAQLPELQTKVTDYETRLSSVGQFENVMANEPERFLGMLARIPAYKEFFEFVQKASDLMDSQAAGTAQAAPGQEPVTFAAGAGMPEPDEELSDGSKVYSMEGLKTLLAWNAQQVEQKVTKQFEDRYKTVEPAVKDWQEQRRIQAALPVVRKQIEEAKQWPLFAESEEAIIGVLKANPQISLEGAYRQIVFPKLVAERNKVRQDVIREAQTAPTSTSVPTRAASKPGPQTPNGPRKLEDIIKEQVERLK